MRFGSKTIPGTLFALARSCMLERDAFTPAQLRHELVTRGYTDMQTITEIRSNHAIIADRVMREVIRELVAAGELEQQKRGLWMRVLSPLKT